MDTNLSFSRSRDSEAAFGTQSATMGGSFWMFGATMTETNGHKLLFFSRDSKAALGIQSATMGGSFWMFGATMTETNGHKLLFF